jgi:hypothetical protein
MILSSNFYVSNISVATMFPFRIHNAKILEEDVLFTHRFISSPRGLDGDGATSCTAQLLTAWSALLQLDEEEHHQ